MRRLNATFRKMKKATRKTNVVDLMLDMKLTTYMVESFLKDIRRVVLRNEKINKELKRARKKRQRKEVSAFLKEQKLILKALGEPLPAIHERMQSTRRREYKYNKAKKELV